MLPLLPLPPAGTRGPLVGQNTACSSHPSAALLQDLTHLECTRVKRGSAFVAEGLLRKPQRRAVQVGESVLLELVTHHGYEVWVMASQLKEAAEPEQQVLKRIPCTVLGAGAGVSHKCQASATRRLVWRASLPSNSAAAHLCVRSAPDLLIAIPLVCLSYQPIPFALGSGPSIPAHKAY